MLSERVCHGEDKPLGRETFPPPTACKSAPKALGGWGVGGGGWGVRGWGWSRTFHTTKLEIANVK